MRFATLLLGVSLASAYYAPPLEVSDAPEMEPLMEMYSDFELEPEAGMLQSSYDARALAQNGGSYASGSYGSGSASYGSGSQPAPAPTTMAPTTTAPPTTAPTTTPAAPTTAAPTTAPTTAAPTTAPTTTTPAPAPTPTTTTTAKPTPAPTPPPTPTVTFTSGLGGITKEEFVKPDVLTAYKTKIAAELNALKASRRLSINALKASRRRLNTLTADNIDIINIEADASGGITFDVKIEVVEAAAAETMLSQVDNFVEKLEDPTYATQFKTELKTELTTAGATIDNTKFDNFTIAEATKKPVLTKAEADDDGSGVAIGVGAGVGVPLFLALLYFIRRHYQNKSDGGVAQSGGKVEGTLKAGDEASGLSAAV